MTKVLLLNDTSKYHNGCIKVVNEIRDQLPIVKAKKKIAKHEVTDYDYIVLNGEGTMHHDARVAIDHMFVLEAAQQKGIRTAIINTVWQELNSKAFGPILHNCEYISVREVNSQEELWNTYAVDADVRVDMSYWADVPEKSFPHKDLRIGQFFHHKPFGQKVDVDVFKDSWEDIVNTLRHTNLFITGRHHEMYAALKAGCPFLVLQGNTWKNEGLLKTAGVDIPTLPTKCRPENIMNLANILLDKYGDQYEKLFKFMKQQEKPDLKKLLKL